MHYHPISDATAQAIVDSGLTIDEVRRVIARALDEDFANGPDVTSSVSAWERHLEVSLGDDGLAIRGGVSG